MIWLTWRQFRVQAVSVYAALAVVGVILAVTGPGLVGRTDFSDMDVLYQGSMILLHLLPAVAGVFWGVPMITRELETGTHSLVWNQSVTRRRWLATKLGVGGPAAMVAAGLLSLAVSLWAAPIDRLASAEPADFLLTRMSPVVFAARGIAPLGYAAFAFVLGVALGMVLRRTVAAMAVTLVLLAAVQLAFPFVRQHVLPPTEETVTITKANIQQIIGNDEGVIEYLTVTRPAGAWVLANETVDASGNVISPLPDTVQHCVPRPNPEESFPDRRTMNECLERLSALGYRQNLVYQPATRFWPLQSIELALYLVLAGLLTWFCFRRLRHLS